MVDEQAAGPLAQPKTTGVADRRTGANRRQGNERRSGADRRKPNDRRTQFDPDAMLAELENRIAAAIRQETGAVGGDGSGWDKLIVPFR